jgi:hypothetical protein
LRLATKFASRSGASELTFEEGPGLG